MLRGQLFAITLLIGGPAVNSGCSDIIVEGGSSTPKETEGLSTGLGNPTETTGGSTGTSTTGSSATTSTSSESTSTGGVTGTDGDGTTVFDTTTDPPICNELSNDGACYQCLSSECADAFAACQADCGCVAIMACAAENGCLGTKCLELCADVIDEYGGPLSPSSTAVLMLTVCAEDKCSTVCR